MTQKLLSLIEQCLCAVVPFYLFVRSRMKGCGSLTCHYIFGDAQILQNRRPIPSQWEQTGTRLTYLIKYKTKRSKRYVNNSSLSSYVIRMLFATCHGKCNDQELIQSNYISHLYHQMSHVIRSKKISNDQELIQSDPTSCPQNQKGNN